MPIENLQQAAQQIALLLNSVIRLGGFRLKFRAMANDGFSESEEAPQLIVEFAGPDAPLLTQRHGELLRSLEHLAAQSLRLDAREQYLLSFDALSFKAIEAREMRLTAETAAAGVIESGMPYSFSPTNSRERRMMHLLFKQIAGVETASQGEGLERYLVVYPEGKTHLPAPVPAMPQRGGFGGTRSDRSGRPDQPRRDGGFRRR